jgi:hypothetical protein
MLIYAQKPEDQYYKVIDEKGPSLIVFGEQSEQWTTQVITLLERNNPPIYFFPWSKVKNIRIQLGLIKYPVTQVWRNKSMLIETVGYQEENIENVLRKFFQSKRGHV